MHVSDYLSKVTQPEAPLTPLTTQVPGGSSSASFAVLKTLPYIDVKIGKLYCMMTGTGLTLPALTLTK